MENAFVLSWILQERLVRIDIYVLADELFRRRFAEIALEHYDHNAQLCTSARRLLADEGSTKLAEALEGSWQGWARREDQTGRLIPIGARSMFRDLGIIGPDGSKRSFIYDAVYFDQSHHIHSTVASMRAFDLGAVQTFQLGTNPDLLDPAVVTNSANLFMIQALADFADFTGSQCFEPELTDVWNEMKGARNTELGIEPPPR